MNEDYALCGLDHHSAHLPGSNRTGGLRRGLSGKQSLGLTACRAQVVDGETDVEKAERLFARARSVAVVMKANLVAPGFLGPIHRRIGFPEDVVGGQSMVDEEGDADADRAVVFDRRRRLAFASQGQRVGERQAATNLVGKALGPDPRFGFVCR